MTEIPEPTVLAIFAFESPSVQESATPDFLHLLQGRKSEHLIFEPLQRVHATEVLFLLAIRRAL
jgi:hypothetical protein